MLLVLANETKDKENQSKKNNNQPIRIAQTSKKKDHQIRLAGVHGSTDFLARVWSVFRSCTTDVGRNLLNPNMRTPHDAGALILLVLSLRTCNHTPLAVTQLVFHHEDNNLSYYKHPSIRHSSSRRNESLDLPWTKPARTGFQIATGEHNCL
jgi:hypothetical protein